MNGKLILIIAPAHRLEAAYDWAVLNMDAGVSKAPTDGPGTDWEARRLLQYTRSKGVSHVLVAASREDDATRPASGPAAMHAADIVLIFAKG